MSRRPFAACLALVIALTSGPGTVLACSRVLWNDSGRSVLVFRTMDLYTTDRATILVTPRGVVHRASVAGSVPPWRTRYGSAVITAAGISASDGINERGLVVNLLYLSGTQYEEPDARPTLSNISMVSYVLDHFATVQEALAGLEEVRIISAPVIGRDWPVHMALADASGDSAIMEFVDHQRIVHHGREFRVMTNEPRLDVQLAYLQNFKAFGGTMPMPGDIDPVSRFVRASSYLGMLARPDSDDAALAKLFSVAANVAVPFDAQDTSGREAITDLWPTLWTAVADSTRRIYYFHSSTSRNLFWVDLTKLNLASGHTSHSVDAYSPGLSGDITARFRGR